ncbi:MAG TPA: T9SS type A sorting domain-containing protein [Rhodothermales bacterium]
MRNTIRLIATFIAVMLLCLSTAVVARAAAFDAELDVRAQDQPRSYTLSAAYPNPFNPTTTFSLVVRERQHVRVSVYNLLGQPVTELFDGVMLAGETRTFTFDAGNLPSGIYLYRVTGETFTAARQMTLIK